LAEDNRQFVVRDAVSEAAPGTELEDGLSADGRRVAGELAAFLEQADEGYAICICGSPATRRRILASIRGRLQSRGVGVLGLDVPARARSVTAVIREGLGSREFAALEKDSAKVAISVNNIADAVTREEWDSGARPAPIQGLNQQRDWVRKLGRPVVFWIDAWLAGKLPLLAPDFWVGRSVVFEFSTETEFRDAAMTWIGEERIGFVNRDEAMRKVRIFEDLARDEKQPEQRALHLAALGTLLKNMADYARAEEVLKQALALAEATAGEDSPHAIALNNLAQLYQDTNRLAEAEPLMRRALAVFEKSYGPDRPEVAAVLSNLALLVYATNRLSEAEPLMRRALEILHKSARATGHQHPHLQVALANYAGLLKVMGRSDEEIRKTLTELAGRYGLKA